MATLDGLPDLSFEGITLHHCTDDYLSTLLIFHGPATGASSNSSRIQTVIFSSVGWKHYPRITLSPTSPLYAAVNHLPRERQGDETLRGIAVSILKYFADLSDAAKDVLSRQIQKVKGASQLPRMFDEMHAAEIANRMERAENTAEIIKDLQSIYAPRMVSSVDVDFMLPSATFCQVSRKTTDRESLESQVSLEDQFGAHADLIEQLGEPIFMPTSKVRRAPSKASSTSKNTSFATEQKEALRLAMCEIVDTEERYVAKIYDLVHSVIQQCREQARNESSTSSGPNETDLARLFPPCLDEVLQINLNFLRDIRGSLEDSEVEALEDIAKGGESATIPKRHDPLGAVRFGRVMLEWFPKFIEPYQQYMRLQPGFASTLSSFMRDSNSTFARRVQETGEQRLRSLLMEPVQRLPRYSLLIDAMTATMPASHPAVKPLLKARDLVTEICALDAPEADDQIQSHRKIRDQVSGWPQTPVIQGRLVTAIDVVSLKPPFHLDSQSTFVANHVLVLFAGSVALLDKTPDSSITARGFLANLDKSSSVILSQTSIGGFPQQALEFSWSISLAKVQLSHSSCGRILYLEAVESTSSSDPGSGAFMLIGAEAGKASRFCEEASKARIEYRFLETERCGNKWSLHGIQSNPGDLQLFVTLCEENSSAERRGTAPVTIFLAKSRPERQHLLKPNSSNAIISISQAGRRYKMEVDHVFGTGSVDVTGIAELIQVISRRVSGLLSAAHGVENPALADTIVTTNATCLGSLPLKNHYASRSYKAFRPPSPTKLLASIWGGGANKDAINPKASSFQSPVLGNIPRIRPTSVAATPLPNSTPQLARSESNVKFVSPAGIQNSERAFQLLEQTLTSYILALRSRAGNIIGKTLRMRDSADEVAVNDLYNVLLENPGRLQAAAEVSNDVLFLAFENFVSNGWNPRVCSIISPDALRRLQHKFDRLFPSHFQEFFRGYLNELSPQNRRALTAIIKLLADLLDAAGNDGDRGALTVAFAELLFGKADPLKHISLLDRLVDDYEKLFDDSTSIGFPSEPASGQGNDQPNAIVAAKSGSVNSQTSSFRKRFGFGLNRENSKNESESKVSSIIRSLSKSRGSESHSQTSSLSKATLVRSRSIDTDSRINVLLRPVSRDRPLTSGSIVSDEHAFASRPGSAHSNIQVLEAIGELPAKTNKPAPKKKRRSSLSDLKSLNATIMAPISPTELRKPLSAVKSSAVGLSATSLAGIITEKPLVQEKSQVTTAARIGTTRVGSPVRLASPTRQTSPVRASPRKENVLSQTMAQLSSPPLTTIPRPASTSPTKGYLAERAVNRRSDEMDPNSKSPKKRSNTKNAQSSIPTSRTGLRERSTTADSKAQSPIKRRDEPLATSPQKPLKGGRQPYGVSQEKTTKTSCLCPCTPRLVASERLVREITAENEALYERFNKELALTTRNVKAGKGEEDLRRLLKDAHTELEKSRKEVLKLRRENAMLRAAAVTTATVAMASTTASETASTTMISTTAGEFVDESAS